MTTSRFSMRNLLAGNARPAPAEDDEPRGGGADNSPTVSADVIDREANAAIDRAASEATAAANKRWNTVMTSDAGVANPKGASHLLMMAGGAASADEVIASLTAMTPAAPAAPQQTAEQQRAERTAADREALAGNPDARPDTGGAGGTPEQRRGEGDNGRREATRERRARRAEGRNRTAQQAGGKKPSNA